MFEQQPKNDNQMGPGMGPMAGPVVGARPEPKAAATDPGAKPAAVDPAVLDARKSLHVLDDEGLAPKQVAEAKKEVAKEAAEKKSEASEPVSEPAQSGGESKESSSDEKSAFGKMGVDSKGKPSVVASTEYGKTSATISADRVQLKFPKEMPEAERVKLATDAMKSLGAGAKDDKDMKAKVVASVGSSDDGCSTDNVFVKRKLEEASPEKAAEMAKQQWSLDKVHDRENYDGENMTGAEQLLRKAVDNNAPKKGEKAAFDSQCTNLSTEWQNKFAEKGQYVPMIDGNEDHRYLVAGGKTIMDPSIGQMFTYNGLDEIKDEKEQQKAKAERFQPFVGGYDELAGRVQTAVDGGYFKYPELDKEGKPLSAQALIEKNWGMQAPGKDGKVGYNQKSGHTTKDVDSPDGVELPKKKGEPNAAAA